LGSILEHVNESPRADVLQQLTDPARAWLNSKNILVLEGQFLYYQGSNNYAVAMQESEHTILISRDLWNQIKDQAKPLQEFLEVVASHPHQAIALKDVSSSPSLSRILRTYVPDSTSTSSPSLSKSPIQLWRLLAALAVFVVLKFLPMPVPTIAALGIAAGAWILLWFLSPSGDASAKPKYDDKVKAVIRHLEKLSVSHSSEIAQDFMFTVGRAESLQAYLENDSRDKYFDGPTSFEAAKMAAPIISVAFSRAIKAHKSYLTSHHPTWFPTPKIFLRATVAILKGESVEDVFNQENVVQKISREEKSDEALALTSTYVARAVAAKGGFRLFVKYSLTGKENQDRIAKELGIDPENPAASLTEQEIEKVPSRWSLWYETFAQYRAGFYENHDNAGFEASQVRLRGIRNIYMASAAASAVLSILLAYTHHTSFWPAVLITIPSLSVVWNPTKFMKVMKAKSSHQLPYVSKRFLSKAEQILPIAREIPNGWLSTDHIQISRLTMFLSLWTTAYVAESAAISTHSWIPLLHFLLGLIVTLVVSDLVHWIHNLTHPGAPLTLGQQLSQGWQAYRVGFDLNSLTGTLRLRSHRTPPIPARWFLVRHRKPENADILLGRSLDPPLAHVDETSDDVDTTWLLFTQLQDHFRNRLPIKVVISPSLRARQTAQPFLDLAREWNVPLEVLIDERAFEMDFGDLAGQRRGDLTGAKKANFARLVEFQDVTRKAPGGEAPLDVIDRAHALRHEIELELKKNPGMPVVVFSHWGFLNALSADLEVPAVYDSDSRYKVKNFEYGSVTEVQAGMNRPLAPTSLSARGLWDFIVQGLVRIGKGMTFTRLPYRIQLRSLYSILAAA
jgi:broad specificity phosphatase PhoE